LIYVASDEVAIAKYEGYTKVYISICGDSLRALGLEGQFRFFIAINSDKYRLRFPSKAKKYRDANILLQGACKWKVGRLDIGCSDFNRKLPMKQMLAACRKKNFSGFAKRRHIDDFETEGTIYLGARGSNVLRRAYDESAKTGGMRDALRFESEFKNLSAQVIYENLLKLIQSRDYNLELIQDGAYQFLKECCFGGFDFVERFEDSEEKETHLDRCERLPWWQEYLDYVEVSGIRMPSPSTKKTIEAKIEWVVKQVLPTLALIKRIRPADFVPWFLEAIRQADSRITDSALAMLRVWKGEILDYVSSPLPDYGVDF
jgi:DNA relaxase NicK